jgi:hypothetical protein
VTDFGREGASDKPQRRVGLVPVTNGPPACARVPLSGDFRTRRFAAKCRPSTVAGNSHPKVPLPRINRLRVTPHPSEANRAVPKASSILRGTEGSNLLPSRRESIANLTPADAEDRDGSGLRHAGLHGSYVYVAGSKAEAVREMGPYHLYFNRTLFSHGNFTETSRQRETGYASAASTDYVSPEPARPARISAI